jgi:hypothetical protein
MIQQRLEGLEQMRSMDGNCPYEDFLDQHRLEQQYHR